MSLFATGTQSRATAAKIPAPSSKDLICLGGNVGAAYMGQHVLEREKGAFLAAGEENAKQPDLSKYKYLLSQYLCPEIPANVIDRFTKGGFYPTAGVFDTRGLAEALNSLCEKTGLGAKDYLDRLPIASETFEMAAEINIDAVTAAINGGEDYRLLYTIPLSRYEEFKREIQTFDVIGHLAKSDVGAVLVTPDGAEMPLREL
jgi:thiamine-monophosphate kinase